MVTKWPRLQEAMTREAILKDSTDVVSIPSVHLDTLNLQYAYSKSIRYI